MHEDPLIYNYVSPQNKNSKLKKGMVFCIEPMSWMTDAPNLPLPAPVSGFSLLPPESGRTFCCTLRVEEAV